MAFQLSGVGEICQGVLLSAFYVPGTILTALYVFPYLILMTNSIHLPIKKWNNEADTYIEKSHWDSALPLFIPGYI